MSEKLVTVAQFNNYMEADLARQLLKDAGIKAFVMGENVGNVWGGPPASDMIELQTAESEAEEAGAILAAHAPETAGQDEDLDFDEDEPDLEEERPADEQE